MNSLNMLPEEQAHEYIDRVLRLKAQKQISQDWEFVAAAIFEATGIHKSVSTWRRHARKLKELSLEDNNCKVTQEEAPFEAKEIEDLLFEFRKERVKLSDERTQNNAYIRRIAREETIKEIASAVA